ncbi:MAG: hypothetical protein NZ918_02235 [Aigarchaeota archaeon]|nr:hypothetical protein [Aigarchaeota archaeon]MDW8021424.1 hypothetical protein [Nitrososphaerota archaeon]
MILAEKLDQRSDLANVLREWLQRLADDAACGNVSVDKTADGWMHLEVEDEVLMGSIIRIQTRINPIVSDKPPFPVRILRVGETSIKAERPDLEGKNIYRSFSTTSFAASLGYDGEDSRRFLEAGGIIEGSIVSISADLPSFTQLKLTEEYILKGLDRLLIHNAAPQEVKAVLANQEIRNLIVEEQPLTLSTHLLYLKLGAALTKAYERLKEELETISSEIKIKPLSWGELIGARVKLLGK